MPEGPLGGPRITNLGPFTRRTEREIRENWDQCARSGKEKQICEEIKVASIAILEDQGTFADYKDLVDINSGNCYKISEHVYGKVDDVRVLRAGDGDHFWIEYNGRHYDAEVPTGVSDKFNLPIFARISPHQMLDHLEMVSDFEGGEPPETIEDIVIDVTDKMGKDSSSSL